MKDGRRKGLSYQNDVARKFSYWLARTYYRAGMAVYDLPFRSRSTSIMPMEGHWRGEGDLLHKPLPGILCPFAVEVKKVEGWSLDGMGNDRWPVWDWWLQAVEQARKASLHPLLVFSRNRQPDRIMLTKELATCLKLKPKHAPVLHVERCSPRMSLVIGELDDLVETDLAAVRRAARLIAKR